MNARAQAEIDRMVEMRLAGATLQKIGNTFGLTRERIRQILVTQGVTDTPWTGFRVTHYRRLVNAVATVARLTVQNAQVGDEHFPHGTHRGYARGCSCDACRTANRERLGYQAKNPRPEWRKARTDGTRRAANYYGRTQ